VNKKLTFSAVIVLLLLAFILPTAAQEQVTLTYALWDNNQLPAHQQIIDMFEAEHPNIHIEPQVFPWDNYWDKLQTSVAGGESFDLFWLNATNFPVYAGRGALLDLQPLVDSGEIDMSVFPQSLIDLYTFDGDVYGIPKDFDTIALYYNKDLFDAAGLAYPDDTWTWDDLKSAAEKLTGDGIWGFIAQPGGQVSLYNFILQNEGHILSEDNSALLIDEPASCDAVKYLYSFVEEGLSPDGATQQSADPESTLFPGGVAAMMTSGSWNAAPFHDAANIGVAPLPMGKTRASVIHGLANVVWSGTAHPDEAMEFAKYLSTADYASVQAETGTVIPAYTGYAQTWVDSIPDMDLQVFIDATEYSQPLPVAGAKGREWQLRMDQVLLDVWSGNIPIDEACSQAATAANEVLNQ
jgi:multiple sugar transport system substrate-binding protein